MHAYTGGERYRERYHLAHERVSGAPHAQLQLRVLGAQACRDSWRFQIDYATYMYAV